MMRFKPNLSALAKKSITLLMAICLAGGWYFWEKSAKVAQPTLPTPHISSEIAGVSALSTNPNTGEVEYRLTAGKLTQDTTNANRNLSILHKAVMDWTPSATEHYTLTANLATLDEKTGDLMFDNGFSYTRNPTTANPTKQDALIIKGDKLIGNTKTKLLFSNSPLQITQGSHTFNAQGMTVDLTTQDYEFHQIELMFMPPKRTDTPLF